MQHKEFIDAQRVQCPSKPVDGQGRRECPPGSGSIARDGSCFEAVAQSARCSARAAAAAGDSAAGRDSK